MKKENKKTKKKLPTSVNVILALIFTPVFLFFGISDGFLINAFINHSVDEIISNDEEYIIIVSHGDLLSVFNSMWLGLSAESLEKSELFGVSGGVSFLFESQDGKRFIKKMSDTSYMK